MRTNPLIILLALLSATSIHAKTYTAETVTERVQAYTEKNKAHIATCDRNGDGYLAGIKEKSCINKIEIAEGKKEVAEGKKEVAEGKKEIAEGKKEIAEGKKEIAEGKKEIAELDKEIAEIDKRTAEIEKDTARILKAIVEKSKK